MTTPGLAAPAPRNRLGLVAVGVATFVVWLGLFSWDNEKVVRGTTETGPYEPWQVVTLVVLLAVVLAGALLLGVDAFTAGLVLSGTIAVAFMLSLTVLAPPATDASLWPIGVVMIFLGAGAGCALLTVVVAMLRRVGALVAARGA